MARRDVALIFQQFNLIRRLTALQNVLVGRLASLPTWRVVLRRFPRADRQLALACLDRVGLVRPSRTPAPTSSPEASSSAWRSRARWPRRPRVILADEPVASLDPESAATVLETLARRRGAGRGRHREPAPGPARRDLRRPHRRAARRAHRRGRPRRRASTRARIDQIYDERRHDADEHGTRSTPTRSGTPATWAAASSSSSSAIAWPALAAGAGAARLIALDPGAPADMPAWCRLTGTRARVGGAIPCTSSAESRKELSHGQQVLREPHPREGQHRQGDGRRSSSPTPRSARARRRSCS